MLYTENCTLHHTVRYYTPSKYATCSNSLFIFASSWPSGHQQCRISFGKSQIHHSRPRETHIDEHSHMYACAARPKYADISTFQPRLLATANLGDPHQHEGRVSKGRLPQNWPPPPNKASTITKRCRLVATSAPPHGLLSRVCLALGEGHVCTSQISYCGTRGKVNKNFGEGEETEFLLYDTSQHRRTPFSGA